MRPDAAGKFTFENVEIPTNKKLLIEVTFSDGQVVPTEQITVGNAHKADQTVYLPDLYAERPVKAQNGEPAKPWKIIVNNNNLNQQTANGDNTATQH